MHKNYPPALAWPRQAFSGVPVSGDLQGGVQCAAGSRYVVTFPSRLRSIQSNPGLDCTGRLFVSDRAHLVFDFHQIVDGLKEVELGGKR